MLQGRGQLSEPTVQSVLQDAQCWLLLYLDDGTAASGKHHIGNPCQLFIGGLSHSTTEASLRKRVSSLGELTAGPGGLAASECCGAACRPVVSIVRIAESLPRFYFHTFSLVPDHNGQPVAPGPKAPWPPSSVTQSPNLSCYQSANQY